MMVDAAAIAVPEDQVEPLNQYLRSVPRARTIFERLKMTTVRVEGDVLQDIERLVRHLEERANAEMASHPVQSGDLSRAAQYLRTLFPPGHPLYRVVYLKRGVIDAG